MEKRVLQADGLPCALASVQHSRNSMHLLMETGVKRSGVFCTAGIEGNESCGGAVWSMQPQKVVFASRCACDWFGTCREGGRLLTRHRLEKEVSVALWVEA